VRERLLELPGQTAYVERMKHAAHYQMQVPPQMVRNFAGVRGRVQAAVSASPPSVTLADARNQVQRFERVASKKP